jgi:3-oxoacyl-[acyl-carrier protein] reductase
VAGSAIYAGTKAAVIAMTEAFAKELGGRGITVNSVAPGLIETDLTRQAVASRGAAVAAETPLGRIGQPEDVAGAVAFFASEDSGWVTGRTLRTDGGIV